MSTTSLRDVLDELIALPPTTDCIDFLKLFQKLSQTTVQVPDHFKNHHPGIPWDQLEILDRALVLGSCECHYGVQPRLNALNDEQVKANFMNSILQYELKDMRECFKIIDELPGVFRQEQRIAKNVWLIGDYYMDEASLNLLDAASRALYIPVDLATLQVLEVVAPHSKAHTEPQIPVIVVARHLITVGECFTQLKQSNFLLPILKLALNKTLGESTSSLVEMCMQFRNDAAHGERKKNEKLAEIMDENSSIQLLIDFLATYYKDERLTEPDWRERFRAVSDAARVILSKTFGYEYNCEISENIQMEPFGIYETNISFVRTVKYTGWAIPNENPLKPIKLGLNEQLSSDMSWCYYFKVTEYSKTTKGLVTAITHVKPRDTQDFVNSENKYGKQEPGDYAKLLKSRDAQSIPRFEKLSKSSKMKHRINWCVFFFYLFPTCPESRVELRNLIRISTLNDLKILKTVVELNHVKQDKETYQQLGLKILQLNSKLQEVNHVQSAKSSESQSSPSDIRAVVDSMSGFENHIDGVSGFESHIQTMMNILSQTMDHIQSNICQLSVVEGKFISFAKFLRLANDQATQHKHIMDSIASSKQSDMNKTILRIAARETSEPVRELWIIFAGSFIRSIADDNVYSQYVDPKIMSALIEIVELQRSEYAHNRVESVKHPAHLHLIQSDMAESKSLHRSMVGNVLYSKGNTVTVDTFHDTGRHIIVTKLMKFLPDNFINETIKRIRAGTPFEAVRTSTKNMPSEENDPHISDLSAILTNIRISP